MCRTRRLLSFRGLNAYRFSRGRRTIFRETQTSQNKSSTPKGTAMNKRLEKRKSKRARRRFASLLAACVLGLATTSGCSYWRDVLSPYNEVGCCTLTTFKARSMAKRIWREQYAHCYGNAAHGKDIRQGFIDGFVDTSMGGNGCPPLVPPTSYCAIGRKPNATAWFQGYPLGIAAAESTGSCNMCQTGISPALIACMKNEECTPGCIPCQTYDNEHEMLPGDPLFEAIEDGANIQAPLVNEAPQAPMDIDAGILDSEADEASPFDKESDEPTLEDMEKDEPTETPADADASASEKAKAIERAIDEATSELEPVSPSAKEPKMRKPVDPLPPSATNVSPNAGDRDAASSFVWPPKERKTNRHNTPPRPVVGEPVEEIDPTVDPEPETP